MLFPWCAHWTSLLLLIHLAQPGPWLNLTLCTIVTALGQLNVPGEKHIPGWLFHCEIMVVTLKWSINLPSHHIRLPWLFHFPRLLGYFILLPSSPSTQTSSAFLSTNTLGQWACFLFWKENRNKKKSPFINPQYHTYPVTCMYFYSKTYMFTLSGIKKKKYIYIALDPFFSAEFAEN